MSKAGWAILGAVAGLLAGGVLGFLASLAASKKAQEFPAEAVRQDDRAHENESQTRANDAKKADLLEPRMLKRPAFELKYPENWSVDTKDEDYDPDHFFSVEGSEGGSVMFFFFNVSSDPAKKVESQVTLLRARMMKDAVRSGFTRWGRYEGCGALLKGRIMGVFKGQVRVFPSSEGSRSLMVVEQALEKDWARVTPGLKMIEDSFHWTKQE